MAFLVFVLVLVAVLAYAKVKEQQKVAAMTPEQRRAYQATQRDARATVLHGPRNRVMVCPHCHSTGAVRTKPVARKKGISGGKATAALLTGGATMLATGLSRKEYLTRAHCDACTNEWDF